MAKTDKLLAKMRQNTQNWRIDEIVAIAKRYGIKVRKGKGSHVV